MRLPAGYSASAVAAICCSQHMHPHLKADLLELQAATPPPETAAEAAAREASGSVPPDPAPDSCRPLAYADAVQGMAAVKEEDTTPGRQLWGHDVFYIFFRLHHYLYERCVLPYFLPASP